MKKNERRLVSGVDLCYAFPRILVRTINRHGNNAFNSLEIILTGFFFRFTLVTTRFHDLRIVVGRASRAAISFGVAPRAAVAKIKVGGRVLLFSEVATRGNGLWGVLSFKEEEGVVVEPIERHDA